jgi:hypothetical protein
MLAYKEKSTIISIALLNTLDPNFLEYKAK